MRPLLIILLMTLCSAGSLNAEASGTLAINSIFDYWYEEPPGSGQSTAPMVLTKTLTNNTTIPLFFMVSLSKVNDPFGEAKGSEPLTLREMAQSIMVYPQRLMIRPGRSASVNLSMPQGRNNTELAFYRISFNPVVADKTMGFDLTDEELEELTAVGTQLLLGMSSALVVEPTQANDQYKVDRKGDQLTITNEGNTLLKLETRGYLANTPEKDFSVRSKRIYPGQSEVLDLEEYEGGIRAAIVKGGEREFLKL